MARHGLWAIAALAAVAYLATGLYIVQPDECAIVRRFGRALDQPVGEGLHCDLPWGLSVVDRVKVDERRQVAISASWEAADPFELPAPIARGEYLTGDQNLVHVSLAVQYAISDPKAYLFASADVERTIASLAESHATTLAAGRSIDEILLAPQSGLGVPLVQKLADSLRDYGLGVRIENVNVTRLAAPQEVADAFNDVLKARSDREKRLHDAKSYQARVAQEALAQVQQQTNDALAHQSRRLAEASSQAQRFADLVAAYRQATHPAGATHRMLLEVLEESLPKLRKVLVTNGSNDEPIDLSIMKSTSP